MIELNQKTHTNERNVISIKIVRNWQNTVSQFYENVHIHMHHNLLYGPRDSKFCFISWIESSVTIEILYPVHECLIRDVETTSHTKLRRTIDVHVCSVCTITENKPTDAQTHTQSTESRCSCAWMHDAPFGISRNSIQCSQTLKITIEWDNKIYDAIFSKLNSIEWMNKWVNVHGCAVHNRLKANTKYYYDMKQRTMRTWSFVIISTAFDLLRAPIFFSQKEPKIARTCVPLPVFVCSAAAGGSVCVCVCFLCCLKNHPE